MKQKFSRHWVRSTQPRKQRKYRINAPLHVRQKLISAHLDKPLRQKHGNRALPCRKGDEVVVMRGSFRGRRGIVSRVSLKRLSVYVEGIKRKKASGQETEAALEPSNLKITKLYADDKKRKIFRKKQEVVNNDNKKI